MTKCPICGNNKPTRHKTADWVECVMVWYVCPCGFQVDISSQKEWGTLFAESWKAGCESVKVMLWLNLNMTVRELKLIGLYETTARLNDLVRKRNKGSVVKSQIKRHSKAKNDL